MSELPILKPIAVSILEACRISGLGRTSIYELIREGRLASLTLKGRRLVLVASLEALLAAA